MSVKVPSDLVLMEGERPYWYGRRSLKSILIPFILGLILLLFGVIPILGILFIVIGIIIILRCVLAIVSTEYFISSHRVYVKYGIIARRVFEIKNEWITTAAVRQGVIGRILNYGDILISVPGHYLGTIAMYGVSDPLHVKAILDDTLRRFREAQKILEELKILEREYNYGRISREKYEELKKKYEEELKKIH
jgi:uncharacterized membrane protein YdbT with pleckstrin-like domain